MTASVTRKNAVRFIVCLGIVSLFADMTYEGAYSIIGPFFKELGMTAAQVGLISGAGEMIAASLRFSSSNCAHMCGFVVFPLGSSGSLSGLLAASQGASA